MTGTQALRLGGRGDRVRLRRIGRWNRAPLDDLAVTYRTADWARADRNRTRSSSSIAGSRHWLACLVKTWMAVAPIAAARGKAVLTPPLVETCAPNNSSGCKVWVAGRVQSTKHKNPEH